MCTIVNIVNRENVRLPAIWKTQNILSRTAISCRSDSRQVVQSALVSSVQPHVEMWFTVNVRNKYNDKTDTTL